MKRQRDAGVSQAEMSSLSGDDRPLVKQRSQWRKEVQLILSPGMPDQDGLRSVVREWLVPLLVRQYLAERGIELSQGQNKVISNNPSTRFLAKEHAAKNHVIGKSTSSPY
ncbi:MAG TPA: hypothetical protein VKX41_11485 [Alloacidobacterium sp.]|nr:hypothetical protein [Alloacidobacterium sp.]